MTIWVGPISFNKVKSRYDIKGQNNSNFQVKPAPAPTCDDGVKNQGEERIDCGGPCPACPVTMPPTTPADRVYR